MKTLLLLCLLSVVVAAGRAAEPENVLATLTIKADADTLVYSKSAGSLVAKLPSGVSHEIDTDLEWTIHRQGDQQVIEIKLPAGTKAVAQTRESEGQVVLKLVRRDPVPAAIVAAVTAPEPSAPATVGGSGPDKPKPPSPVPPEIAGFLSEVLGQPPGEVKFDPAARTDFDLPRTPAAAAIGSKAETIRPITPRVFATELLSKVGDDGSLNPGFAFAATPYLMLKDVSLKDYRAEGAGFVRFLSRLQLSLASTKADDARGQDSVLASVALSGLVFDFGDPRQATELDNAFQNIFPATGLPIYTGEPLEMKADKTKAWSNAIDNWNRENWNKARMGFGYAPRWITPTGKFDDLSSDGGVAWLSLALPGFGKIAKNTQFLSSVQYRHGEKLPYPATPATFGSAETWSIGGQLRVGSARFNGFAEAFWNRRAFSGGPKDDSWSYEIGAEKRLTPSLWLQISAGKSSDASGETENEVKSGLRYAFGDGPKLELK